MKCQLHVLSMLVLLVEVCWIVLVSPKTSSNRVASKSSHPFLLPYPYWCAHSHRADSNAKAQGKPSTFATVAGPEAQSKLFFGLPGWNLTVGVAQQVCLKCHSLLKLFDCNLPLPFPCPPCHDEAYILGMGQNQARCSKGQQEDWREGS